MQYLEENSVNFFQPEHKILLRINLDNATSLGRKKTAMRECPGKS